MGRVVTQQELIEWRSKLKNQGKKVIFTNGCFDILHRGHIEYLAEAKALGDALVVGVNADESVRRLKGANRPIIGQEDRALLVAALSIVDRVCLFQEDTPLELIQALVPDVLVKGADWAIDKVVGKDIVESAGGSVQTIKFIPHYSTTSIIQKILETAGRAQTR
jgi:rfaE bifunctional protein nucleotidyltransferase chain/domain